MFFMKISRIIPILILSFFVVFSGISAGYAAIIQWKSGTESNTKDPTSNSYYNNDFSKNELTKGNADLMKWVNENPDKANEIIKNNGNECGINCAKDLEDAQKAAQANNQQNNNSNSQVASTPNILWQENSDLRAWNVDMDTIPKIIAFLIEFIIGMAGTIAILMLIYFAVRMQLASGITGDSSWVDKAKKGMIAAGVGFLLAISAWFIMSRFLEILTISAS